VQQFKNFKQDPNICALERGQQDDFFRVKMVANMVVGLVPTLHCFSSQTLQHLFSISFNENQLSYLGNGFR